MRLVRFRILRCWRDSRLTDGWRTTSSGNFVFGRRYSRGLDRDEKHMDDLLSPAGSGPGPGWRDLAMEAAASCSTLRWPRGPWPSRPGRSWPRRRSPIGAGSRGGGSRGEVQSQVPPGRGRTPGPCGLSSACGRYAVRDREGLGSGGKPKCPRGPGITFAARERRPPGDAAESRRWPWVGPGQISAVWREPACPATDRLVSALRQSPLGNS
jgi:hypothetical protein